MKSASLSNRQLDELPLSRLIRLAVLHGTEFDKLVQSDPERFRWDMSVWLRESDGVCSACMAGAVLYGQGLTTTDVWNNGVEWCRNLNAVRIGCFSYDATSFGVDLGCADMSAIEALVGVAEEDFYLEHDRFPWRVYMGWADILERAGL